VCDNKKARRRHLAAQPGHPREAATPPAAARLRPPGRLPHDGAVGTRETGAAPPVPRRRHRRLHVLPLFQIIKRLIFSTLNLTTRFIPKNI